jgi:SAM-dependent methyltransferase
MNLITPMHKKTSRDYLARMTDDKVEAMKVSKRFGKEYWDGPRRYGYGGYKYDGRWKPLAERLIEEYRLPQDARILDVGCGKAFLLHELKLLLPQAQIVGFDISAEGIADAPEAVRPYLSVYRAQDAYPYGDKAFDLALSLNALHNLRVFELETAFREIERVAAQKFVVVESYRNEAELFNLECWSLTCESFFDTAEWIWLMRRFGYSGDYEFIYFE